MIHLRPMLAADLPLGLRLSRQAGWNQTETDWRRALDLQPDGCFVAECDGVPAGTTTTCLFGDVGWIAMVLVDERLRRRGIGLALMQHALAFLDAQDTTTIRLDATPLGQPLYEQLGFVAEYRLARYEGILEPVAAVDAVEGAMPQQWEALAALDAAVTGTDRRSLLFRLFADEPGAVRLMRNGDDPTGFMAAPPAAALSNSVRALRRRTSVRCCSWTRGAVIPGSACTSTFRWRIRPRLAWPRRRA